eukprot:COSAG06_NODE_3622_length_5106_cov_4.627721_3_plen_89_part_00
MRDQEVAMAQLNMQRASATREPIIFPIHGMAYEYIQGGGQYQSNLYLASACPEPVLIDHRFPKVFNETERARRSGFFLVFACAPPVPR